MQKYPLRFLPDWSTRLLKYEDEWTTYGVRLKESGGAGVGVVCRCTRRAWFGIRGCSPLRLRGRSCRGAPLGRLAVFCLPSGWDSRHLCWGFAAFSAFLPLLLRLPPGHLAQALLQSVIVDSLEFAYANKCINWCKWEAKGSPLRVAGLAPSSMKPRGSGEHPLWHSLTLPSARKPAVVSISAQSFHSERSPSCQDFLLSAGLKFPASLGLHWVAPKLWDWNGRFRMTRNMIRINFKTGRQGCCLL